MKNSKTLSYELISAMSKRAGWEYDKTQQGEFATLSAIKIWLLTKHRYLISSTYLPEKDTWGYRIFYNRKVVISRIHLKLESEEIVLKHAIETCLRLIKKGSE